MLAWACSPAASPLGQWPYTAGQCHRSQGARGAGGAGGWGDTEAGVNWGALGPQAGPYRVGFQESKVSRKTYSLGSQESHCVCVCSCVHVCVFEVKVCERVRDDIFVC